MKLDLQKTISDFGKTQICLKEFYTEKNYIFYLLSMSKKSFKGILDTNKIYIFYLLSMLKEVIHKSTYLWNALINDFMHWYCKKRLYNIKLPSASQVGLLFFCFLCDLIILIKYRIYGHTILQKMSKILSVDRTHQNKEISSENECLVWIKTQKCQGCQKWCYTGK